MEEHDGEQRERYEPDQEFYRSHAAKQTEKHRRARGYEDKNKDEPQYSI